MNDDIDDGGHAGPDVPILIDPDSLCENACGNPAVRGSTFCADCGRALGTGRSRPAELRRLAELAWPAFLGLETLSGAAQCAFEAAAEFLAEAARREEPS